MTLESDTTLENLINEGEQLIIDMAKYKGHPKCKTLYCFVYAPNGNIMNPRGIEKDLSGIKE